MIESIVLGIVQGITEFLPISSSAHLVAIPYIFNWQWQGLVFDVALHFGTLLAIIIYFRKDLILIFRSAFTSSNAVIARSSANQRPTPDYQRNLLWMLLLATIPGGVAGVFLEKEAATIFRSPLIIAINLAVFGLIIYFVDKHPLLDYSSNKSSSEKSNIDCSLRQTAGRTIAIKDLSFKKAFLIGIGQMLAIVPGVSRSGATMATGRMLGLNRPDSARFSFLLAMPIMLGSALFEARHFTLEMFNFNFVLAFVTSFIFGLLAIKYLLKYLERGNFGVFTVYRLVLAVIIFAVYFLK